MTNSANYTGLTHLSIPVPPMLAEAIGYTGEARFFACTWSPYGDECRLDDGRMDRDGEWDAFLAYTEHRKIAPALQPYDLGSSEQEARHMLILDREAQTIYVALRGQAGAFLMAQWPPLPQLAVLPATAQEVEEMFQDALDVSHWTQITVSMDEIKERMHRHQVLVAELIAWLTAYKEEK